MFTELPLRKEYRSFSDDIVNSFYIPLLSQALLYQRAVGFFSSTALVEVSLGISALLQNGGKIQLIASPRLQEEDIKAITKGYADRADVIERVIIESIVEPKNYFEEQRLNILATLISQNRLDIKIAFTEEHSKIGMYHEKVGLLHDNSGNTVAFTGSMNETSTAFAHNYEAIDVFCSWTEDSERVLSKQTAFNALWNDYEPKVKILDFPMIAREKLQSYQRSSLDLEIDYLEYSQRPPDIDRHFGPCIPSDVHLHDYQLDAIQEWELRGYQGIFDMATGTGKTYTGLGAITCLYDSLDRKLAVIIVCPYQHLVEQWVEDICKFNMRPIIGYSASSQRDWKARLKEAITSFKLGVIDHFCFVTTNATFQSKYVTEQVDAIGGNLVLVVDEAHNFGAENLSKYLNTKIPYRLALSATLDRHGDEEGTMKLYSYFGQKCIEYSLERAIAEGKLTPYYYYPIVVHLTEDELEEYKRLSAELSKHCRSNHTGKLVIDDVGKLLLIKRARIVAGAKNKLTELERIMKDYIHDQHILVYCGAATIHDAGFVESVADESEIRQIDAVCSILGNRLKMRLSQFTSAESSAERELLKREFSDGKHLQALVAIRCLDEGVNIPSIKVAFILASSTNPKEYIQRRGRVLRKAKDKSHAVIYDFITLPRSLDSVMNLPVEEMKVDVSLVKKEISRLRDFSSIANNPSEADSLISRIEETYSLLMIGESELDI